MVVIPTLSNVTGPFYTVEAGEVGKDDNMRMMRVIWESMSVSNNPWKRGHSG
jgi:hypothetical protein